MSVTLPLGITLTALRRKEGRHRDRACWKGNARQQGDKGEQRCREAQPTGAADFATAAEVAKPGQQNRAEEEHVKRSRRAGRRCQRPGTTRARSTIRTKT